MTQLEKRISVLLVEDEAVIRQGLADKIPALDSDFTVVAQASNGTEALEAVRMFNPQVVITDIKMPQMDGIALAEKLSRSYPTIKVVIVSGYSDFAYTQRAIRFGVFNYLLKPVTEEALTETLRDLKNVIASYKFRQRRTVVYSRNYIENKKQPCKMALFAVCIGNLCFDVEDELLSDVYEQQLAKIDWHPLLDELCPTALDWYLADEEEKNQKVICYSVDADKPTDNMAQARRLQQTLQSLLQGVPVNVCTAQQNFAQADAWICAQRMRNILKQKIVPAQAQCFVLEQDERFDAKDALDIIKMRVADNLRRALNNANTVQIQEELRLIFSYLADSNVSQLDVQRVILHILHTMEFSSTQFVNLQTDIMRKVSRLRDADKFVDTMVDCVLQCLQYKNNSSAEDAGVLARNIKVYLDDNYLSLESLEEMTKAFSYSYEHLSRQFSKENGMSMNRYVLLKRMDLAKQLIENNDNLNMTQIGQMAGFPDGRYFSRIFKNYVGCSPSEYKSKIIVKG